MRADSMAVRADDVAFRDLGQERARRPQHRPARSHAEQLDRSFTVVDIHLMGCEATATILAWPAAELAEELQCSSLPAANALQVERAVPAVVVNVR